MCRLCASVDFFLLFRSHQLWESDMASHIYSEHWIPCWIFPEDAYPYFKVAISKFLLHGHSRLRPNYGRMPHSPKLLICSTSFRVSQFKMLQKLIYTKKLLHICRLVVTNLCERCINEIDNINKKTNEVFLILANPENKRRNLMQIKILYSEVNLPLHT